MAQVKYLDEAGLAKLVEEIVATFVKKEYKTGSQTVYKVLSDNNLTDELVQKIKKCRKFVVHWCIFRLDWKAEYRGT